MVEAPDMSEKVVGQACKARINNEKGGEAALPCVHQVVQRL